MEQLHELEKRVLDVIQKNKELLKSNNELKKENVIITPPQTTILFSIMKYGPQSMNALSKLLFIKNSTTTGLVDRLEKNGLVSRNTVGNDRRKWDIAITKEGIKHVISEEIIATYK